LELIMKNEKPTLVTAVLATEDAFQVGVSLSATAFDDMVTQLQAIIGKPMPMVLPLTIGQLQPTTEPKTIDGPILREVTVEGEVGERKAVAVLEFSSILGMERLVIENKMSIGYEPPAGTIIILPALQNDVPAPPWNTCPACSKITALPDFEQPGTELLCSECGEALVAECYGDGDNEEWALLLASEYFDTLPESPEDNEGKVSAIGQELPIEFACEGEELDGEEPTTITAEMFDDLVAQQRQFIGQPLPLQTDGNIARGPVLKDVVVKGEDGKRVAIAIVIVDKDTDARFVEIVEKAGWGWWLE
jgi:hypothetical protein